MKNVIIHKTIQDLNGGVVVFTVDGKTCSERYYNPTTGKEAAQQIIEKYSSNVKRGKETVIQQDNVDKKTQPAVDKEDKTIANKDNDTVKVKPEPVNKAK